MTKRELKIVMAFKNGDWPVNIARREHMGIERVYDLIRRYITREGAK